jgi:hypothetical protein
MNMLVTSFESNSLFYIYMSVGFQNKSLAFCLQELEAALADSQLHVTQLEDALARSSHASNSSLSKAETEDLNEVYEKLKCLERECDRLRQEAAILESKVLPPPPSRI